MLLLGVLGLALVALASCDELKVSNRCTKLGELLGDPHNSCNFVQCTYGDEPWVDPKTGKIAFFEVTKKCPKGTRNDLKNFNAAHPCAIFDNVCMVPLKPKCKKDGDFLPDLKDVCKYKRCTVAEEPWIDPHTGLQLIRLVETPVHCAPGSKNQQPTKFNTLHPCDLFRDGTGKDCAVEDPHPVITIPQGH